MGNGLSQEVFPARISVLQEGERESLDRGPVFGLSIGDLLGIYDPESQSWKTSVLSLFEEWTEYLVRFPKSGIMLNGRIYGQATWVRRIGGKESGLWPTPTQIYTRENWKEEEIKSAQQRVKSETMAKGKHHTGNGFGLNLAQAIRMWPTPCNRDFRSPGTPERLERARLESKRGQPLTEVIGGQLNPMWVEWLMGYPIGWTDLEDSEMRLSLR